MTTLHRDSSARMGGTALIVAALGFIGVFAYLAARFNYPTVLEAPAATALPPSGDGARRSCGVGLVWMAGLGLAAGILGWIAMWRNVTGLVAPVAALNNAVLPLWMIVFGFGLLTIGRSRLAAIQRTPEDRPR